MKKGNGSSTGRRSMGGDPVLFSDPSEARRTIAERLLPSRSASAASVSHPSRRQRRCISTTPMERQCTRMIRHSRVDAGRAQQHRSGLAAQNKLANGAGMEWAGCPLKATTIKTNAGSRRPRARWNNLFTLFESCFHTNDASFFKQSSNSIENSMHRIPNKVNRRTFGQGSLRNSFELEQRDGTMEGGGRCGRGGRRPEAKALTGFVFPV